MSLHDPNGDADAASSQPSAAQAEHEPQRDETEQPWTEIAARWRELLEYSGYYVAANIDRLRLKYRTTLMWAMLGVVLALVAVSVVAAAAVLLVVSASSGVGQLLGGRVWLGQLVVSLAILLSASGGVWFILRCQLRAYQRELIEKYEGRKAAERAEHGTDVEQRARERATKA